MLINFDSISFTWASECESDWLGGVLPMVSHTILSEQDVYANSFIFVSVNSIIK